MINVVYMVKILDKKKNEFKRDNKQTKKLNKIKSYEDFIIEITKAFDIKDKNKICLIAITNDDDEIPIKNEEDYIENLSGLKQYLFYLEEEQKIETEKQQLNEEDFNFNINIDFSVEEIINNIKSQIKERKEIPNNNENDNDFDYNKYKEDQKSKNKKLFDKFGEVFNSELKDTFNQKGNLLTNLIIKEKNDFSKFCLNNMNSLFKEINKSTNEFSYIVNDYSQFYNSIDGKIDQIFEDINIRFLDDNLELEKTYKEAKYINIQKVTIENFGFKTYKTLYLIKDEYKSSKDIFFFQNNLNESKINYRLTLAEDFSHGKKESHEFIIKVENPKPNQEYTLYLNVKEKEKGIRLSKPFKIIVKIKDDPHIKEAEKLYEEFNKQYPLSEIFEKDEIMNKIINEKFDKDLIKIWIQTRLQEKNNIIAEKLFDELNNQFNLLNNGFDKLEIINQIIEENFNRNKLRDWAKQKIESRKTENIFIKFDKIYNFSFLFIDKQEIIDVIIKEKFNEEKIEEWIKNKIGNPAPSIPILEKEVENIYNELENEFNVSSSLDRNVVINIIRKFGCDREKIRKSVLDLI
jgi:hypothetical protein